MERVQQNGFMGGTALSKYHNEMSDILFVYPIEVDCLVIRGGTEYIIKRKVKTHGDPSGRRTQRLY